MLTEGSSHLELERSQKGVVQDRIGEDGQDVLKENAWRRKVGELTEGLSQLHCKMGEFGGAGGGGGGDAGGWGGLGGIWLIAGAAVAVASAGAGTKWCHRRG